MIQEQAIRPIGRISISSAPPQVTGGIAAESSNRKSSTTVLQACKMQRQVHHPQNFGAEIGFSLLFV